MKSKQLFLSSDNSNCVQVEWEEDYSYLSVFQNAKKIGEFMNKDELRIGKSFILNGNILFIVLDKQLFSEPKLTFLINGTPYEDLYNIYRNKLFGLSIMFQFLAGLSIISFFDFYHIGFYSIISGSIYLGLGYVYFVKRRYSLGWVLVALLILDISYNIIVQANKLNMLDLPSHISMRIIMCLATIISLFYNSKEKKNIKITAC